MRNKIYAVFLSVILLSIDVVGFTVSGKITTTDKTVQYPLVRFVLANDTSVVFSTTTDTLGEYTIVLTEVSELATTTQSFTLYQNYPNPFSERTTIMYTIKQQSPVEISIYNILGQRVKTFRQEFTAQNIGHVQWDCRDELGKKVAYGIYFYRITSKQGVQTKKMVYVKPSDVGPFLSHHKFVNKTVINDEDTVDETYTVYIENTDSTKPKIEPLKIENVVIQGDTVINFQVEEAAKWEFLGLEGETVTAIAVHPTNPSVLYVGTAYDFSAGHMGKLFKTTNSGMTWDTLLVGQPLFSFRDIVVDPIHPDTVYTIPLPVLKSTNGGKTWFEKINGIYVDWETRASSLTIDPLNTNNLYCGTGGFFGGRFYKSTNGGESWRDLSRGTPEKDTLREGVISIAIDPNNSNIVYAGTPMSGELWKTTDAGETWILTGLGVTNQMINDVLIHPTDSRIIFVGISEIGVWKTEDGGNTWIPYNAGLIDSLKSAMKLIMKSKSSEIFLVIASPNNPGIYKKSNDYEPWLKFGINNLRKYYYSDLKLSNDENTIYFGSRGIYIFKFR